MKEKIRYFYRYYNETYLLKKELNKDPRFESVHFKYPPFYFKYKNDIEKRNYVLEKTKDLDLFISTHFPIYNFPEIFERNPKFIWIEVWHGSFVKRITPFIEFIKKYHNNLFLVARTPNDYNYLVKEGVDPKNIIKSDTYKLQHFFEKQATKTEAVMRRYKKWPSDSDVLYSYTKENIKKLKNKDYYIYMPTYYVNSPDVVHNIDKLLEKVYPAKLLINPHHLNAENIYPRMEYNDKHNQVMFLNDKKYMISAWKNSKGCISDFSSSIVNYHNAYPDRDTFFYYEDHYYDLYKNTEIGQYNNFFSLVGVTEEYKDTEKENWNFYDNILVSEIKRIIKEKNI